LSPILPVRSCIRIDAVALRRPDQYSSVFFVGTSIKRLVGRLVLSFNEIVDQHAKEAAREPDGPQNPHNRHIRLAAAARRANAFVPKPSDQVEAACEIDLSRWHPGPTEGLQRCLAAKG
jgi:hypothetical protein